MRVPFKGRIEQHYIQKAKIAIHVFQILFIFIGGCITLAIFTKDTTGGALDYYFALCFFTIIPMVYLVMVPMWSRTIRFANAYAFAIVDALLTIFWFAAFVSVAAWSAAGIRKGAKEADVDSSDGNCTTFAYGTETACKLARATMGFGVVIFILFALTAAISGYIANKYRKGGTTPWDNPTPHAYANPSYDSQQKTDAWSADTGDIEHADEHTPAPSPGPATAQFPAGPLDTPYPGDTSYHGDTAYRPPGGGYSDHDDAPYGASGALLHSTETDEGRHPGHRLEWGQQQGGEAAPPYPVGPSDALSPGGYEEYRPQGRGYGFS